jgi:hypothetical protein
MGAADLIESEAGNPMVDLSYYMSDELEIKKTNGSVHKQNGLVSRNKITLADLEAPVEEGDEIIRHLPSGVTERYDVLHVQHYSGLRGTGAHIELDVRKAGSRLRSERPSQTVYNITGNNPRVNVNSTDQSVNIVNTNSEDLFDKLLKSVHERLSVQSYGISWQKLWRTCGKYRDHPNTPTPMSVLCQSQPPI